jgi:hypothetical protein
MTSSLLLLTTLAAALIQEAFGSEICISETKTFTASVNLYASQYGELTVRSFRCMIADSYNLTASYTNQIACLDLEIQRMVLIFRRILHFRRMWIDDESYYRDRGWGNVHIRPE